MVKGFGEPSLEVARLLANAIAVQQRPVQHIAVVGAGDRDHDGLMGIDVAQHRRVTRHNARVIDTITCEFLIVFSFIGENKSGWIDQGSKLVH